MNLDNYECEGQLSLFDTERKEPVFPVDIRGLCDDAYCPKCKRAFEDTETDIERCPKCGCRVDWTPWHYHND